MKIQSMSEAVYKELRSQILDGSYAPGAKMNVDELARRLDTSKTPVREALGRLASEGLVIFRSRSGWSVPALTLDEFVNFLEMQFALRFYINDNLAQYIEFLDFNLLNSINQTIPRLLAERNYLEIIKYNDLFHMTIFKAHKNHVILRRLEEIDGLVRLQRVRFFEKEHQFFPVVAGLAYEQHQKILQALERGDSKEISDVSREHHQSIVTFYKQILGGSLELGPEAAAELNV